MAKMSDYLYQMENLLNTNKPCVVTIDMEDYDDDGNIFINEDEGTIWVKNLISKIEFEDLEFNLILDYSVILRIHDMEKTKEFLKLKYPANETILEASLEVQDIKQQVYFIERLMSGKEIFKDVHHFLMKLYKMFKDVSNMDLLHLEILASNALRDKQNSSIPARLGKKWDPKLISMKDIVYKSGFMEGLSFENIGKSINVGLISEPTWKKTILEKVLTGTIVEKKKEIY